MEPVSDESRTLRRTMRDLVALSALPAVWAGYRPLQVAEGLADVLLSTLRLDLVYIRLPGQTEGQGIDVARTAAGATPTDQTRDIGRALAPWLDGAAIDSVPLLPNPAGPGTVRLVVVHIGCGRQDGVLVAGSQQTAFPSEEDQLLLSVGANQAAAVLQQQRAEAALRESEHRWRSLTEALPQLVWTATPDGSCDYFGTQWTQHTGVPQGELLGWRWLDVLHPDDRECTRQAWTAAVQGPGTYDVEYRVRRADGAYRWFKTRGVPIRDSEGTVFKWFGTCTDITDLRRTEEALRESEERFRGTFENAAVGIAHVDVNGRFLRVNEKLCDILGYTREELLAEKFQDVTFPDDLNADLEQLAPLLRGDLPSFSRDKRYLRKDGSIVWVAVSVSLQRDAAGRPLYTISVTRDISHRKRLETEFRHAREVAEAANRAKDEFLANVSHEIRTPMNAILGMTELALDTPLTDDQRQCLKTVKSAADNLLGIINDLLDFSKIEAGKLELDPADFSLRTTVADTLRALAVRAHSKGLELIYHVHPEVPDALVGDAGRLRQVLLNLVATPSSSPTKGRWWLR